MAEPLNATFFAFRKRERGGVLTGLTVAYFVASIILIGGFIALNLNAIASFGGWYFQLIQASAAGDPNAISSLTPPQGWQMLLLTFLPFIFLHYVLLAAYEAGCQRWMIRGQSEGLMGLSLSADTWRVYSTYWVWFGLYMGYSIVGGILMGVVAAGVAIAAQNSPALMLLLVPFYLLYYGVMLFFAVRLAPAAAVSVGRRKFSFFSAWTATKGRFWAMFGAYLLIILMMLFAQIVIAGVAAVVIFSGAPPFGPGADPGAVLQTVLAPRNLFVAGVGYAALTALSMLVYVLFFGVNARAVLAAAEEGKIDGVVGADMSQTFA